MGRSLKVWQNLDCCSSGNLLLRGESFGNAYLFADLIGRYNWMDLSSLGGGKKKTPTKAKFAITRFVRLNGQPCLLALGLFSRVQEQPECSVSSKCSFFEENDKQIPGQGRRAGEVQTVAFFPF